MGIITMKGSGANAATRNANARNRQVTLINCTLFTDCITETNNAEVDSVKDLDVVMPMYNLIECSNNYAKISEGLWKFTCIDVPT